MQISFILSHQTLHLDIFSPIQNQLYSQRDKVVHLILPILTLPEQLTTIVQNHRKAQGILVHHLQLTKISLQQLRRLLNMLLTIINKN